MGGFFYRVLHSPLRRIVKRHDTPHQVALGVAIGVFVAWTPTIGLQSVLAWCVAACLGANRLITLPAVWITNPLTAVPIYWASWAVGSWLLPSSEVNEEAARAALHALVGRIGGGLVAIRNLFDGGFWHDVWMLVAPLAFELWVGSIVVGFVAAGVAYGLTRPVVGWYLRRRRRRWAVRRAVAEAAAVVSRAAEGETGGPVGIGEGSAADAVPVPAVAAGPVERWAAERGQIRAVESAGQRSEGGA